MRRLVSVLAVVLVPGTAHAQLTTSEWPGLVTTGLPLVYVLDGQGVETAGRLIGLNPDSLVLLTENGERQMEATQVRRIERHGDSLRNGALIGAAVGIALGLVGAGLADCPTDGSSRSCPGFRVATFAGAAGIYTAIGVALDALVSGRTTLYEAPPVPAVPGARAALSLRVRW